MSRLKHIVKGLTHAFTALAGAVISGGITLANGSTKKQKNQALKHLTQGLTNSTTTTPSTQQQVAQAVANNRARGTTEESQAVTRFREANAKIKNKTSLGGQ